MTSHMYNPADEIQRLIRDGRVSEDTLLAVTGIAPEKLRSFLAQGGSQVGVMSSTRPALSMNETTRLTILGAQLTDLIQFDNDDERLAAILQGLTGVFRLTLENISRLTALGVEELQQALEDPQALPAEKKYELAMRSSYLLNALNAAQGERLPQG